MAGIDRGTRDRLVAGLLEDAQRLRTQLFKPVTVFAFAGRDGEFHSHRIGRPDARAQADMMRAATMALTSALALDRATDDTESLSAVDTWLDAMTAGSADNRDDPTPVSSQRGTRRD